MHRWLLVLLLLAAAAPVRAADRAAAGELVRIPQGEAMLLTRICRPAPGSLAAGQPARIAIFSHGRAPAAAGRAALQPLSCANEAARWFTAHGFLLIAPLRIGYGQTGGPDVESVPCTPSRDYVAAADIAARAIAAAIAYAETLPDVRKDAILLIGQSAGGLASIAYARHPSPAVSGVINMAGGNGGHLHGKDNAICHPDRLIEAAGRIGATSRIPELWVYAANDSYFAPDIAAAMHLAFTQAGGTAALIQPGAFGSDGHRLFLARGGAAVWGGMVARYLGK